MAAAYTCAARYEVEARCQTPLRTGGSDGNLQTVLESWDGTALLQASSLAGALRSFAEQDDPVMAETLFGSQNQAGHLLLSDGVFDPSAGRGVRPRLRIDGKTGTADNGGKFDIAHIDSGSRFRFSLTWLGSSDRERELNAVEGLLGALHHGQITLGAQKNNGFGRVRLEVYKRVFDMTDPADRTAWLAEDYRGARLELPETAASRCVTFLVSGRADSLLVKSGAPLFQEGRKGAYIPNLTEKGRAVLPGSSVKGAVRARAEMIADFLGLPSEMTEEMFGREAAKQDNGRMGQIIFEDACLSDEKKQQISRIRINRFTGGVIRNGLFCEEPLSCGVELRIGAVCAPAQCGLLVYALRDLGLGLYSLGSGSAIGRGYLSVEQVKVLTPDGKTACLRFDAAQQCTLHDPDGVIAAWLKALEEL